MKVILTALTLALSLSANSEMVESYVDGDNNYVNSIVGNLYIDDFTFHYNRPHLIVRHMGTDQASTIPKYDVGYYTGFDPISSRYYTTRSAKDGQLWEGVNAYQMQGTQTGIMLNSWSFPEKIVIGGGQHAVWSYLWNPQSNDTPKPWKYLDGSELTVQALIKIPHAAYWNGGVGQVSFVIYGQDISDKNNPKLLAYLINIYDNRGSYQYNIGNDGSPFVSTPIENNPVVSQSQFSHGFQSQPWSQYKFFRAHISEENLINAINMLNKNSGYNYMSDDPQHYQITSVHVLVEIFEVDEAEASIGVAIDQVGLLSCKNKMCN